MALENLNRALSEVFFSHWNDQSHAVPISERELAERLSIVLDIIFKAVSVRDFDPHGREWITDDIVADYFGPKQFGHLRQKIKRGEVVDYNKVHARHRRIIFRAICSLAKDVFSAELGENYHYVGQLRNYLIIRPGPGKYQHQNKILSDIEADIDSITAPPDQLITFTSSDHDVLIKIHAPSFCHDSSKNIERIWNLIIGKYVCYRELFNIIDKERQFIREFMTINVHPPFGCSVLLESKGGPTDINSIFKGVALVTDGMVSIIIHCDDPSARLRVLNVALKDWRALDNDASPFCSAVMLGNSHIDNIRTPASRNVLFRRERESDNLDSGWCENRVSHLSMNELSHEIETKKINWLTVNYLP